MLSPLTLLPRSRFQVPSATDNTGNDNHQVFPSSFTDHFHFKFHLLHPPVTKNERKSCCGVGKAVSRFRFLRLTHRAAKVESKHGPRLRTSVGRPGRPKLPSRLPSVVHKFPAPPDCGLHFHCSAPPKTLHHFLLNASSQLATLPCTTTPPPNPGSSAAGSPAPAAFRSRWSLLAFSYLPTYLSLATEFAWIARDHFSPFRFVPEPRAWS